MRHSLASFVPLRLVISLLFVFLVDCKSQVERPAPAQAREEEERGTLDDTSPSPFVPPPSQAACAGHANAAKDLESGNMGLIERTSSFEWTLTLRDDNGDCRLPRTFRGWWYVRLADVPTGTPVTITLQEQGWNDYYVPVYSYDQVTWHRFEETQVTQPQTAALRIEASFQKPEVFLARFYPYPYSRLNALLRELCAVEGGTPKSLTGDGTPECDTSLLKVRNAGYTPQGRAISALEITSRATFSGSMPPKERIWLHARTHPGETGGSFVIEGALRFLLGDSMEARWLRERYIFHIVPMHNVDGVVVGNYRTTPASENLELGWVRNMAQPLELASHAPHEVKLLHALARDATSAGGALTLALNLHSSHSPPDMRAFFFPHFGPREKGYAEEEAVLWQKQVAFMELTARAYEGRVEPPPPEGGREFAKKTYPESWWWANFKTVVNALTLETTYGRAGFAPRWVTEDDLEDLGVALMRATYAYGGGADLPGPASTPSPGPTPAPLSRTALHDLALTE